MAKKSALGKGIASLLQEGETGAKKKFLTPEVNQVEIKKENKVAPPPPATPKAPAIRPDDRFLIDIKAIKVNPNQPRKIFKERDLSELASSIKEHGIIQPLLVTKIDDGFQLIAGERRLRAAKSCGVTKVPVIVKKVTTRDAMALAIIENIQRSDLNCVEEALAYYQLMTDFNLTQEEVAKKLGKERSTIANFLRILKLPRQVLNLLQKELLSFGHAKVLASVKEEERAIRLADKAVEESLSVRELEKLAKQEKKPVRERPSSQYDDRLDHLKSKLEQKTGFHFLIKSKTGEAGTINIKFSNEAEFNDIYEFLMKR